MTSHVKIHAVSPRIQYIANGTLKAFEFPFAIFKTSDIDVYFGDSLQDTSNYTVSDARQSDGGTVTFESAPTAGTIITIARNLPIERTTDFQEGSALRANVLNDELDYQIACQQQIADNLNRSMILPPYAVNSNVNLTLPSPSAGKAIVWSKDGTNLENSTVEDNALENILKGYKESAESAAAIATTKASIASDKADIATTKAGIAAAKAEEAASTLSSKANKDMDNLSSTGKSALIALGMPDISRQTTLSVTTTPKQAEYDMFINMISTAGSYLFVSNDSTYDTNSNEKRRVGFINGATNEYQSGCTVIAKGQWYYTNGTLNAVYACPFKGE